MPFLFIFSFRRQSWEVFDHSGYSFWFLVGTYVPLGVLPDFAQLLMKCTPATYIASLYRQVLMKEAVSEAFKGEMIFFENFKKKWAFSSNGKLY